MATLSLNSYSQNDTTKVVLPVQTARLVYKDLLRYDGCKEELKLTQDKIVKLEEREIQKDTIIGLLKDKDKNNQFIISQKDTQISLYQSMADDLKKELKGQRTKTFLYKVGAFLGILSTSYLLIK
jgi:hypothetical protein